MEQFLDALISLVFVYTRSAVIMVFLHCFYDRGFLWNGKKALLLFAFMGLETLLLYIPMSEVLGAVLALVALVFEFALYLYDYQGKKRKGLLRLLLAMVLVTLCMAPTESSFLFYATPMDILETLMTESVEGYFWNLQRVMMLAQTLFFAGIFFYLYYRIYKQNIAVKCGMREHILVGVYLVLSYVLNTAISLYEKDSQVSLIIMASVFMLFSLAVPVFIYYARLSNHYRQQSKDQEIYIQAELAHFLQYKQSQVETARFRHDIRNNLLCIHDLLENGKQEEARDYLKELLEHAQTLRQKYVSGDEILDCIIGVKAGLMEEKGIRFQLDGVLAGGLSWKPVDVCSVFANGLDNAIEACEKLPEESRYIDMTIKSTPQFWFIRIENPVAANVDTGTLFQRSGGFTTKPEAKQHGYGTYNMKHTVERYGGILSAQCSDRSFVLEIMIDKVDT